MTESRFPLNGPINLDVRVGHGSLTVHAEQGRTEAVVELVPAYPDTDIVERTTVALAGNTLTIATPRRGGVFDLFGSQQDKRDAVEITVYVPSHTAMKLVSFTAPIITTGEGGSADIAAGAATVTLDHVAGELRLRLGSGDSDIGVVTGAVQLRSGSGNARIDEVGGDLTSGCGSGTLEVGRVYGRVRSRTGSGTASFDAVYGDVDLASGSGGLTIGLPEGLSAQLQLTTGSGRVASDLPIDDTPAAAAKKIVIRARTGSGDIVLQRAAA